MDTVTLKTRKGLDFIIDRDDCERISQYTWFHAAGYLRARFPGNTNRLLHRFIMGLNKEDKEMVDHIDGNPLKNSKSNLRLATNAQNSANQRKLKGRVCSSHYKGVSWHKQHKKWHSHIKYNGKSYHIGYFHSEEAAAEAYNEKALELFGDFACINSFLPFPYD